MSSGARVSRYPRAEVSIAWVPRALRSLTTQPCTTLCQLSGVLAPESVGEPVRADGLAWTEREGGEDDAVPATEGWMFSVDGQRAQHRDAHGDDSPPAGERRSMTLIPR